MAKFRVTLSARVRAVVDVDAPEITNPTDAERRAVELAEAGAVEWPGQPDPATIRAEAVHER